MPVEPYLVFDGRCEEAVQFSQKVLGAELTMLCASRTAPMEMRGEYREVVTPVRLVSTESRGGDQPETVNTLVLAEHEGTTTMTCTVRYPSKNVPERALGAGMTDGWAASDGRLAAYVRHCR